jgi:phosphate-selective porin OprO and OprP
MSQWGKSFIPGLLALCLISSPGSAWALSAYELLDLLVEEKVISPDKAARIKQKALLIERREKAEVEAKQARKLSQVDKESKDIAKTEAVNEAKEGKAKAIPESEWKAYWKEGLRVESTDGRFKVKVGGRIQTDFASISSPNRAFVDQVSADEGGRLPGSGAEFRRARLMMEGTVYENIFFKAEYDFANAHNGTVGFKDVYIGVKNLPTIGHIRIGHQKEPFSLEELTSSNFITFMERSLPNVFSPARNTGIMAFDAPLEKRLYWGVGTFYNTDDISAFTYNNYQGWEITARLAGTPIYQDKGRHLLHVGFGYSHQFRNANAFQLRYRQRPEAHITNARTVDTVLTPLNAQGIDLFNPELALVWGPFSFQGEYMVALTNAHRNSPINQNLFLIGNNPSFQGAYAYISYFLTGENRAYNQSNAYFGRVKPNQNFDPKGGRGAWEIALRWSYLNLQSKGVAGGVENDFTAGLNWYLTPNARWMFNYVFAKINNRLVTPIYPTYPNTIAQGSVNVAETRFQIDF